MQLIFSQWLAVCAVLSSEGVLIMDCQLMSTTLTCIHSAAAQASGKLQQVCWHMQVY